MNIVVKYPERLTLVHNGKSYVVRPWGNASRYGLRLEEPYRGERFSGHTLDVIRDFMEKADKDADDVRRRKEVRARANKDPQPGLSLTLKPLLVRGIDQRSKQALITAVPSGEKATVDRKRVLRPLSDEELEEVREARHKVAKATEAIPPTIRGSEVINRELGETPLDARYESDDFLHLDYHGRHYTGKTTREIEEQVEFDVIEDAGFLVGIAGSGEKQRSFALDRSFGGQGRPYFLLVFPSHEAAHQFITATNLKNREAQNLTTVEAKYLFDFSVFEDE